jgi:hypothetical protein
MRCALSSNFRPLILLNLLQIIILGLQCLEAAATVAVDHLPPMVDDIIIVVVALPPTIAGVAPISPMMLLPPHSPHVNFVAS